MTGLELELAVLWAADAFMSVLAGGPDFLSAEQAAHVQTCGELYLKLWITLHHRDPVGWKIRPKTHLVHHMQSRCDLVR